MEGNKDELPIEHEGGSASLSESLPAAAVPPADPDLILVRDAAEEFSLGQPAPDGASLVDTDLVIDRSGFNSPDVRTDVGPRREIRPPTPAPPRLEPDFPEEPDLDAIYGASEKAKPDSKTSGAFDWDAAFRAPVDVKKKSPPPSGVGRLAPEPIRRSREKTPEPQRRGTDREEAPAPAPASPRRARRTRPSSRTPAVRRSTIAAALAGTLFLASTVLMALGVEPFHSWYYLFAWYPFLLVANWCAAIKNPRLSLFEGRFGDVLPLLGWSAPAWLFFEVWNFRIQNWYYIGVPDQPLLRWAGILLSFATVLPGIFFVEEALAARGYFENARRTPLSVTKSLLRNLTILGASLGVLILALPDFFFAFVWAVPTLLLEPWLFRRGHVSLLRDLAQGKPGRVIRLLLAGLICGLFWETANFFPGGKWIYTVPWINSFKLFEMPALGFIGFAPFGLACWSLARALVESGVLPEWIVARKPKRKAAVTGEDAKGMAAIDEETHSRAMDEDGAATPPPRSLAPRRLAIAASALATFFILAAMDRWTIDSFTPRPENVPAIPDGVAEYAHKQGRHDVTGLLDMINEGKLYMPGESSAIVIAGLAERCRIVLLRGIGTENALRLYRAGVMTRAQLAENDRDTLVAALQEVADPGWSPKPRRVQAWIEAARRDLGNR